MQSPVLDTDEAPAAPAPRSAIAGWVLFDWAAQPYFTLINTFVYAPFFASAVAANPVEGQAMWGFATATAGVAIALLSPILGAIADAAGRRKPWIAFFGLFLVAGATLLWFGRPGAPDTVAIVLIAFVLATIGAEFATVFNNSMMPNLVPPERMGRLSGLGWAIGYVGGMVSLILMLGFLVASPETGKTLLGFTPLFGLDPLGREGDRAAGPLTALWFIAFVIPLFLFTPDAPARMPLKQAARTGIHNLVATLREVRQYRNVMAFLIANMIYMDGLIALFALGGIYAAGVFGWTTIEIGLFGMLLTITGTAGALYGGRLDDLIGSKPVILGSIAFLTLATFAILLIGPGHIFFIFETAKPMPGDGLFATGPERVYLLLGGVMGAAAGPLQAASRSLLVRLAPRDQIGQFFGLFALSGKVTAFVGPFVSSVVTLWLNDQRAGLGVLLVMFCIGATILSQVRTTEPTA
ncbi:MFS transporter [Phreatobacter aquaticus]|uniref:MFS transporter n=1 Tax=Phreatobacter aquaticus TaxID=2570229 RepID=A0A4D7QHG5_9HYPH|nr:MFS transporter [Phreatobacter aquaticus]QCK85123.1 MFS transporter [Phreatobacter aquaticus]